MTRESEPVSRRLAEVLSAATYADLPAPVVADAKRAVLDWLGSAVAGASETPARLVRHAVAALGASDESTVFGGGRSSAAGAALANGTSSHMLELDDVHKGSTLHPAAPVISAALAVAEREHADGERFLLAVIVGYDAALRIGEAVNPSHYRLGAQWKIGENCYKLHACCGHTHSAIDLALALRAERGWPAGAAATEVAAIEIATYGPGFDIVREPNPRSAYQAKFSIAYCVAVALLEGAVGLEQFSRERFGAGGVVDAPTAALLSRTTVRVDEGLTGKYPSAWPAHLCITFADGSRHVASADFPRGNPENPVPTAALEEKLRALVTPRAGAEVAERALVAVRTIESAADMADLFRGWLPDDRTAG